ncbi:MBL fold metallo-hydrolase [Congregibacter brevis]|uniref:MBL fold metallo-hydrolase n=1 Tax=Congregibacter brevis TaxID=3081201 RepID=A0ABZ0IHE8_9GAMM|nr:MBL fold metallo-hydrolase [Congregibacter sp. IMCC45268]
MRTRKLIACVLIGLYPFFGSAILRAQTCPPAEGVALQVLGSGGPIADDARASSGYLVWIDGRARVLVDLGGGAILRFAQAGASFADLDAVLLSHLHADHSAGLPALLKSGYFAQRSRRLTVAGPSGGGNAKVQFPSLDQYVDSLLQAGSGAYAYLSDYLQKEAGAPYLQLETVVNEPGREALIPVKDAQSNVSIRALSVSHGPVPALAYRIQTSNRVVVFAGDQDGRTVTFPDFAKESDVLVLHMPIPEGAGPGARALHATPSRLNEVARDAGAKEVILSHFMARSLRDIESNVALIEAKFPGRVRVAEDLDCVPITGG